MKLSEGKRQTRLLRVMTDWLTQLIESAAEGLLAMRNGDQKKSMTQCLRVPFAFLLVCHPLFGDVIYFTNGNVLIVDKAWEEGSQVKYQTSSGVQTVPKDNVVRIQIEKPTPSPGAQRKGYVTPVETNNFAGVDPIQRMFVNKVPTRYFGFYSNIDLNKLRYYADFSEMFLHLISSEFIQIEGGFPISAFVLADSRSFRSFLKDQMNISNPPAYGIWLKEKNAFVTYDGAGLGTFAHEIMHPIVEMSLPNRPEWAMEGIPAFFEKFFGYKKNERLYLNWGYQNPWRIKQLGDRLSRLRLEAVIKNSTNNSDYESEQRLVSVFLFEHGKWRKFLDLLKLGDKKGYETFVEAAFEQPLAELETQWRNYLRRIQNNKDQIYRIPLSTVLETEAEYRHFAKQHGL